MLPVPQVSGMPALAPRVARRSPRPPRAGYAGFILGPTPQNRAAGPALERSTFRVRARALEKILKNFCYNSCMAKTRAEMNRAYYRSSRASAARESVERIFKTYKADARSRGFEFDLALEQFTAFWRKPCHYCHGTVERIGLDRVDNSIGYVLSNLVSCCHPCNHMKRNWSREFFVEQCRRVVRIADLMNSL